MFLLQESGSGSGSEGPSRKKRARVVESEDEEEGGAEDGEVNMEAESDKGSDVEQEEDWIT